MTETEDHPATYHEAEKCPLADECTRANFHAWRPWGNADEECRAQVRAHLDKSGYHKNHVPPGTDRDDHYDFLVHTMNVVEKPWQEEGGAGGGGSGKRRRRGGGGGGGGGGGQGGGGGGSSGGSDVANLTNTLANLTEIMSQAAATAAATKGYGKVDVDRTAVTTATSSARSNTAIIPSQHIIKSQELQEVMDSLGRCVTSARHAQRLSATAAQAVSDEATVFENVREFISAKLDTYS